MKRLFFLIALILMTGFTGFRKNSPSNEAANIDICQKVKITKIVDGDTFWATDLLNNNKKYRLIGIDAPETSNRFKNKKHEYAAAATGALHHLLHDSIAYLYYDKDSLDRYKRHLVYVFNSGKKFVNQQMVRNGHAWAKAYPPNTKHQKLFSLSQDSAVKDCTGIWNITTLGNK